MFAFSDFQVFCFGHSFGSNLFQNYLPSYKVLKSLFFIFSSFITLMIQHNKHRVLLKII